MKPAVRDALVLAALVSFGAALRLPYLFAGLWRDEASTYYEIVPAGLSAIIAAVGRGELNPPGFYLFESVWTHVAGSSDLALKLPSFVFGLLLIPATYLVGRAAASRPVALVAAAFACIAPVALRESGEARAYALAALLAAIVLICYLRVATARRTVAPLIGFAVAGAVLVYVHYTGIVLLLFLALCAPYVLWRAGRVRLVVPLAAAYAAIALAYLPWMPMLLDHLATGTPWSGPLPRSALIDLTNNNFGFLLPVYTRRGQIGLLLAAGVLATGVTAGVKALRGERVAPPSGPLTALAVCAVGGALCEVLLSQAEERYMFTFAPAAWVWVASVCVWIAGATARLRPAVVRVAVAVSLAAALLVLSLGEARAYRDASRQVASSSGIRTFAPRALALERERRTLFLAAPDYLGPTLGFYVGRAAGIEVFGFARWAHPEMFSPFGYAAVWDSPGLLPSTQQRIRAAAQDGYVLLCLVRDDDIRDRGQMRFTRTDLLYAWLTATLPHVSRTAYKGRRESVIVDLFSLAGSR